MSVAGGTTDGTTRSKLRVAVGPINGVAVGDTVGDDVADGTTAMSVLADPDVLSSGIGGAP